MCRAAVQSLFVARQLRNFTITTHSSTQRGRARGMRIGEGMGWGAMAEKQAATRRRPITALFGQEDSVHVCASCRRKIQIQQRRNTSDVPSSRRAVIVVEKSKVKEDEEKGQEEEEGEDYEMDLTGIFPLSRLQTLFPDTFSETAPSAKRIPQLPISILGQKPFLPKPPPPGTSISQAHANAFVRLRRESDIDGTTNRLVDLWPHTHDFALWRSLLCFRKRMDGDAGVIAVWHGLRQREVDLPTEGEHADVLWRVFVFAALRDEVFMAGLLQYVKELGRRTKKGWAGLYDALIGYALTNKEEKQIWALHRMLSRHFSSVDWGLLFQRAIDGRPECEAVVWRIYNSLPKPVGVYAAVAPTLCSHGLYSEALAWHHRLIALGDLPPSPAASASLVAHTARTGLFPALQSLLTSLPATEETYTTAISHRRDPREVLEILFATPTTSHAAVLGDTFWAALFASPLGPLDVCRYMLYFGQSSRIGARTITAAAHALHKPEADVIPLLSDAGVCIDIDTSTTSSIPSTTSASDTSPEPFNNTHTDRTESAYILNLRLRHHLRRHQISSAITILSTIRTSRLPLFLPTLHVLSRALLRARRPGLRPSTAPDDGHFFKPGRDVDPVLLLHLGLAQEGYQVPIETWLELVKRLGMEARLNDLERVLFRLVALLQTKPPHAKLHRNHQSALHRLFNPILIHAIVEWGFLAGRGAWGVAVCRRLRDAGVWVDERSVKRGARLRIIAMRVGTDEWTKWRAECERVWGDKLWEPGEKVDEIWDDEKRRLDDERDSRRGRGRARWTKANLPKRRKMPDAQEMGVRGESGVGGDKK